METQAFPQIDRSSAKPPGTTDGRGVTGSDPGPAIAGTLLLS